MDHVRLDAARLGEGPAQVEENWGQGLAGRLNEDRRELGSIRPPDQMPLMLPLPCGDGTVADSALIRLSSG
jgi:hypothetical protein